MDEENEFHERFDVLFRTKNELNNFDFDSKIYLSTIN